MTDVTLRQVKSSNNSSRKQLETLSSLKLGKIGRESKMADSPQLRGMIKVVDHLVVVDEEKAS